MLLLLALGLLIGSILVLSVKKNWESLLLVGLCLSLTVYFVGLMLFIAKKGGLSHEVMNFLFLNPSIRSWVQYRFITLGQLGYLVAVGRYLFPLFLLELASCQLIQNRQNVIMIGNPGRGKTPLAIALGLKACTQGYNVLFKNAATISTKLCEAKDNYHLGKLERTLAKVDLLILDELSYLSFNRHQSELLFKVISDGSEKGSTIVTTSLPFSK